MNKAEGLAYIPEPSIACIELSTYRTEPTHDRSHVALKAHLVEHWILSSFQTYIVNV